ncbi:MAG: hypothetical protein Q4B60_05275 [Erysipelotrichaceae bacterium]|nr:hypothetical protein [Erysipelotrichaceae bacterium]
MKKKKLSKEEKKILERKMSFQERLPIKEIKNRLFVTKKGEYLSVFTMGQKAVDLMSEDEVFSFSRQMETAFETLGLDKVQFLLLPVPFDLAPYQSIRKKQYIKLKKEEEFIKSKVDREGENPFLENQLEQNKLLQKYIDDQLFFVTRSMQSGRVANKHCYIVCGIKERYNETASQEAARQIESVLKSVCDDSRRCSESEMEKILIELYNPLRPEIYINTRKDNA